MPHPLCVFHINGVNFVDHILSAMRISGFPLDPLKVTLFSSEFHSKFLEIDTA